MQISTELKQNVIIFKDGSNKWITDPVYQQLISLGEGEKFTVDGNLYDYNMISKVLSRDEFYKEYPENELPMYPTLKTYNVPIKHDRKRALGCMIRGIKSYINSDYQGTDAPKEILKKWERRYANLE